MCVKNSLVRNNKDHVSRKYGDKTGPRSNGGYPYYFTDEWSSAKPSYLTMSLVHFEILHLQVLDHSLNERNSSIFIGRKIVCIKSLWFSNNILCKNNMR